MHSCFESCRPDVARLDAAALATYKKEFTIDKRPVCEYYIWYVGYQDEGKGKTVTWKNFKDENEAKELYAK